MIFNARYADCIQMYVGILHFHICGAEYPSFLSIIYISFILRFLVAEKMTVSATLKLIGIKRTHPYLRLANQVHHYTHDKRCQRRGAHHPAQRVGPLRKDVVAKLGGPQIG